MAFWGAILLFPGLPLKALSRTRILNIGILFYLIGTVMVWLGRRLFIEGKKLSALPAEAILARDKRPPVLYLRSFELEPLAKQVLTNEEQGRAAVSMDLDVHTQEEILAKTLKRVGPCIAVNDPRSDHIVLGFSRLKLGDDWKQRVQDLIKQCALVVHCAGGTPGLLWELEQVARLVVPRRKLLLIITPTITKEWWALADRLFGGVPRFTVSSEEQQAYIAVIYFDETGRSHNELIHGYGKPPRIMMEEALDPLLHQLNVRPRSKLLRWFSYPLFWFVLFLVCWMILQLRMLSFLI